MFTSRYKIRKISSFPITIYQQNSRELLFKLKIFSVKALVTEGESLLFGGRF